MSVEQVKEDWILAFIFFSGQQWGDPPPTRDQAEEEWEARQWAKYGLGTSRQSKE